ncbi:MAG: LamG-like jellyroll fold domain-containing protein [Planctomycetota bacterium]
MRHYYPSNQSHPIFLLVLLLAFSGFVLSEQAKAAAPPPSGGEEFAYARIFSAKIPSGLDKPLDELEAIAREHGTEEVIMFLPSDGPEKHTERWIIRLGSDEHNYPPGLTVKARSHLAKQKKTGVLKMRDAGRRATAVLRKENARLEWAMPESVRLPLSCAIFENEKVVAVNTIHERLSPSANQRWPEVILIDLPRRDWGIIQVFEYLDERPDSLPTLQEEIPQGLPAEENVTKPTNSGQVETPVESSDGEMIEKIKPILFSASWGIEGFPSLDWDTGWKPGGSPVQFRLGLGIGAELSPSVWGDFTLLYSPGAGEGEQAELKLGPSPGQGNLEVNFGVEMSTRGRINVDLGMKEYDFSFGIPHTPNFDLRCQDSTSFNSYFLGAGYPARVEDNIDTQELYAVGLGPSVAEVKASLQADMSLWAKMTADKISTSDGKEFTGVGQSQNVTLTGPGAYYTEADYHESLDMGIRVTFYPAICAEIDVWIYDWDYCVPTFSIPWDVVRGRVNPDFETDLEFEPSYDLLIITSAGGNTLPEPGLYSWAWGGNEPDEPCDVNVAAILVDPDYQWGYWEVEGNDVNGVNTVNPYLYQMDGNNPFLTLYAVFHRVRATNPFPNNGADKISRKAILSWLPGELIGDVNGHDVYFGTDFNEVNDANSSWTVATGHDDPNVYKGRQDGSNYAPCVLERCQTYYWRVDEVNETDPCVWRGNIWCFRTVGCCASVPHPNDGDGDMATKNVVLSWLPGACVNDMNGHDVYFGTDLEAVRDANSFWPVATGPDDPNVYKGRKDANSYDPCDPCSWGLKLGETYYWRVDEVNENYSGPITDPWRGEVWQFTVTHIVMDDFEDHIDTDDLRATWQVGLWNGLPSDGNVYLGVAPVDPVLGGKQSMKLEYDNSSLAQRYCSVIHADTNGPNSLGIGTDITAGGDIKALTLYFWGDPDNDANETERLFVALEDDFNHGVVKCKADTNDTNEWNIDLNDPNFSHLNKTNIQKIYIGLGHDNFANLEEGGQGIVYFDDIRLYIPRCIPEYSSYDITADCFVNYEDIYIMGRDWLMTDYNAVAVPLDDANLLVRYTFDNNNLDDDSGHGRHGTPVDGPNVHDGILTLAGNNFVEIGGDFNDVNLFDGRKSFTIVMDIQTINGGILISSARDSNFANHSMALFVPDWGAVYGNYYVDQATIRGQFLDNKWHQIATTYDANTYEHVVYRDSVAGRAYIFDPNIPNMFLDAVRIGGSRNPNFPGNQSANNFIGNIDNVKIYNKALSPSEICYLYVGIGFVCDQPLDSPANLYDEKLEKLMKKRKVNFKDYTVLTNHWLEEDLWPP